MLHNKGMLHNKLNRKLAKKALASVKKEMANPRIAKSARIAGPSQNTSKQN
jgi:hypothetical protein